MRTLVIYKEESDHARQVTDYIRDFARQTGTQLETIDPESREGADMCRLYDIVEYPTIVALDSNGSLQNMWRGLAMPTISELSYYTMQ